MVLAYIRVSMRIRLDKNHSKVPTLRPIWIVQAPKRIHLGRVQREVRQAVALQARNIAVTLLNKAIQFRILLLKIF